MNSTPCPGYDEREGTCTNAPLPEVGLCLTCAQMQIERTKAEPQEVQAVRWPHDDMGGMR